MTKRKAKPPIPARRRKGAGRPPLPGFCARCGVKCPSTREARVHCQGEAR